MMKRLREKIILLYKPIYMYVFNVIFCIVLFICIYLGVNYHIATMNQRSIKALGEIQKKKVEGVLDNFRFESIQCSTDSEIVSMDKERVNERLDFIRYYRGSYKDIIVINNKRELLSGYVKNIREYMYMDYVLEALKGKTTVSGPIEVEGKWYIDFVSPIINEDKQLGILSLRISLQDISTHLRGENQDSKIEVYIVDREGYFLTSGKNNRRKVGIENIDINTLKVDIDYAPKVPYKNYDGDYVYGDYYTLSLGDWTLVIESRQDKSALYLVLGASMLVVILIQFLMNRILHIIYSYRCKDEENKLEDE